MDRITRNFKEAVVINDWLETDESRQIHFVKQNLTIHKRSKSDEKFRWDMEIVLAKKYISNLSEEVNKGLSEKASQGLFPGSIKYGYKSIGDKGKKRFIKDPTTHLIVKKLLESYATGNYSMKAIGKMAWDMGLRTSAGRKLYKSQIERLLRDPFYYGAFSWKGKVMKGIHEALITKETFDLITEIRTRRKAPFYTKRQFLFSKLLSCGECGGTITSEVQKGHVYCHCSHYRNCSQKKYTREEVIESGLINVMDVFRSLTSEEIEQIRARIKENHKEEITYKHQVIDNLNIQYKAVQMKIDRLYDDKLSGVVTNEFWTSKNNSLLEEQKSYSEQLDRLKTQEADYFELGLNILELASRAKEIYSKRSSEEKRMLLGYLFEEITLKKGGVEYKLKTPVRKLVERINEQKNNFELKKAFTDNVKAYSGHYFNSMLRR